MSLTSSGMAGSSNGPVIGSTSPSGAALLLMYGVVNEATKTPRALASPTEALAWLVMRTSPSTIAS